MELNRFQPLFENLPIPAYIWQREGQDFVLVEYNRAAGISTTGRIQELLGEKLSSLYADMPDVMADFRQCIDDQATLTRKLVLRSRLTGQQGHFAINYVYVPPDLILVLAEDVSERKQAEQAPHLQAQIIDQTHDSVVSTDLDGYVTSWNKGAEKLFGYSSAAAIGRHISFLYAEDQHDFLQEEVIAPLKRRGAHEIQVTMVNRQGDEFIAHLSLSLLKDDQGQLKGMIGYSQDISELVRAKKELGVRAKMHAVVAELSQQALSDNDLNDLMAAIVNRVAAALEVDYCKILELLPGEDTLLLKAGAGWKDGYVGNTRIDARRNSQAGYTLLSQEPVIVEDLRTETRFHGPPLLTEHQVISGASVIVPGQERPFGILGVHTAKKRAFTHDDINFLQSISNLLAAAQERKSTETALKQSEKIFRQLSENIQEVFWMTDAGGQKILYVSPAYEQVWGRPAEELYKRPEKWLEAIHPEDLDRVTALIARDRLARGEYDLEYRILQLDGSVRWIRDRGFPIRDAEGVVYRVVGVADDITNRVLAEKELRFQAERLSTLREIDQAILQARTLPDIAQAALTRLVALEPFFGASVVIFDEDDSYGTVLYDYYYDAPDLHVGPRVSLAIFGDRQDLTAGQVFSVEDTEGIVNPDPTVQTLKNIGLRSYISVPLITQEALVGVLNLGSTSPGLFPSGWIQLAKEVANSLAIAIQQTRLVNQIQTASRELRGLSRQVFTAQEEERRRISRELHDEAGQALMAVKISLDMVQKDLPPEAESLHHHIRAALELTDETMEGIRLLAYGLRPPELDAVGLDPVLEDYCAEFAKRTHLSVCYQGAQIPSVPDDISISLYRVLQEALTNALKHACAQQVQVVLRYGNDKIQLSVTDDGQGFSLRQGELPNLRGLGIVGMRERLELLGGRLEIDTHPNVGTRLNAVVPWKE